jgi:hypothetical protein
MSNVESVEPAEQSAYEMAEEEEAKCLLFQFIRNEIINKKDLACFTDLVARFESLMGAKEFTEFTVDKTAKKKLKRQIKDEFVGTATFIQNNEGRLLFLPNDFSREELAVELCELKRTVAVYQQAASTVRAINIAAETIRSEVKSAKSSLEWPPKIDNLEAQQTLLTPQLKVFLSKLFGSQGHELDVKVNSLGQDILYVLNNGTFLTTKHVLLPFTVKALTGNVELLKILNRLGHGVSYSKVAEIEAALATQKLSEAETIVPSAIQRNIPATLVFDNIDRLEETLSGSGTTHRVNGIVVQQAFIGPKPFKQEVKLPKTKRRSIEAPIQELPIYISGKKPDAPLKGPVVETFLQNNVALKQCCFNKKLCLGTFTLHI